MEIKPSFVYVVKQPQGLRKIGYTKDLLKRFSAIKSLNPTATLERVHIGGRADELAIHSMFSDRRVSREWFRIDAGDMCIIDEYFYNKYSKSPSAYFTAYSRYSSLFVMRENGGDNPVRERMVRSVVRIDSIVEPFLTDTDKENLRRLNVNLNTAQIIKKHWAKNPNMTKYELMAATGYGESMCTKVLSAFRKSIL